MYGEDVCSAATKGQWQHTITDLVGGDVFNCH